MKKNKMINEFTKKLSAFHLVDELFDEIYNYLTNELEKYPKRREMILIKRKPKLEVYCWR